MQYSEFPFIDFSEEIRYGIRFCLEMTVVSSLTTCPMCHFLEEREKEKIKVQTKACVFPP